MLRLQRLIVLFIDLSVPILYCEPVYVITTYYTPYCMHTLVRFILYIFFSIFFQRSIASFARRELKKIIRVTNLSHIPYSHKCNRFPYIALIYVIFFFLQHFVCITKLKRVNTIHAYTLDAIYQTQYVSLCFLYSKRCTIVHLITLPYQTNFDISHCCFK